MLKNSIIAMLAWVLIQPCVLAQNTTAPTDRATAQSIKPKGTYLIEHFSGTGADPSELSAFTCLQGTDATEKNTHWLEFKVASPQILLFSIAPLRLGDDLDFALFAQNPNGEILPLRCSAQGRQLGNNYQPNDQCLGIIGLAEKATLQSVEKGCNTAQHFLAPLNAIPTLTYYLMVHNYSSPQGFTITFAQGNLLHNQSNNTTALQVGEIFPNPAQNEAMLPLTLPEAAEGELLLLRANGQVLTREPLSLVTGAQSLRIALPQEADELLYVRLLLNGKVFHRKVVTMK